MPQIIPIKDLKNTCEISSLCHNTDEPVFVTKNGYGDMVIMSMDVYEKTMFMQELYNKLQLAEKKIEDGEVKEAKTALSDLRKKYGL